MVSFWHIGIPGVGWLPHCQLHEQISQSKWSNNKKMKDFIYLLNSADFSTSAPPNTFIHEATPFVLYISTFLIPFQPLQPLASW